jgi:hypothetical protein
MRMQPLNEYRNRDGTNPYPLYGSWLKSRKYLVTNSLLTYLLEVDLRCPQWYVYFRFLFEMQPIAMLTHRPLPLHIELALP